MVHEVDFGLSGAPSKVTATTVITREAARSLNQAKQDAIRKKVVSALVKPTNTTIVAALTSGSPASSSDVGTLLASISEGQPRRPVILAGLSTLLSLPAGVLRDLGLLGVTIVPCAEAGTAGVMLAVDASGLLLSDGGAEVATADAAMLTMDDTDASGTPNFSLWQRNAIAVRAERWIAISLRPDATAYASTGSPS